MSVVSGSQPDYGFWEFANCGRCQLPFQSTSGATVPFWLTECGHMVCNNHLNADQSCSICGAPGIQLVPLQREMEAPMSEWFQSVPMCLDAVANAAKFQHETMASQIRYYRSRHQQQRVFIDRLKHDIGELKKDNGRLNNENNQLLEQFGGRDPYFGRAYKNPESERPDVVNSNGKRPRTGAHPYDLRQGAQATSSPRSNVTPLGPNRLTLPHGQPAPNLSSSTADEHNGPSSHAGPSRHGAVVSQMQHRPASGFIDKYAYIPSTTPQFRPQQLTHTQAAPQTFKRSKPPQEQPQARSQLPLLQNQDHRSMPPPPTPARFKAAQASVTPGSSANQFSRPSQMVVPPQAHPGQQQHRAVETFSHAIRQQPSRTSHNAQSNVRDTANRNANHNLVNLIPGTNRSFSTVQHFVPPSSAARTPSMGNGPQRFFPS
ncbi:hypothetical protein FPV67DRAFT_1775201 [Lyophyllum atratum]|nr:hypothetical protein FPV67DRAFT_1775201 [Lyophyllum atratum]